MDLWRYPIRLSNGIVRHDARAARRTCSNDAWGSADTIQWNWTGEHWFKHGRVSTIVHQYHRSNRWSFDSLVYDSKNRLSAVISYRTGSESKRTTYTYSNNTIKTTISYQSTEYLLQEFAYNNQGLLKSEILYTASGEVQFRKIHVYSKTELDHFLHGERDTTVTYILHESIPPSSSILRYYDFTGVELRRQTFIYSDGWPQIKLDHEEGELVRVLLFESKEKGMVICRVLVFDPVDHCLSETLHRYSIITSR